MEDPEINTAFRVNGYPEDCKNVRQRFAASPKIRNSIPENDRRLTIFGSTNRAN